MVYAAAYWIKSKNDEITKMGFNGGLNTIEIMRRFKAAHRPEERAFARRHSSGGLYRIRDSHAVPERDFGQHAPVEALQLE